MTLTRLILKALLLVVLGYALGTLIVFCRLRLSLVLLYGVPIGLSLHFLLRKIRALRPAPAPEREWVSAAEALQKGFTDRRS